MGSPAPLDGLDGWMEEYFDHAGEGGPWRRLSDFAEDVDADLLTDDLAYIANVFLQELCDETPAPPMFSHGEIEEVVRGIGPNPHIGDIRVAVREAVQTRAGEALSPRG